VAATRRTVVGGGNVGCGSEAEHIGQGRDTRNTRGITARCKKPIRGAVPQGVASWPSIDTLKCTSDCGNRRGGLKHMSGDRPKGLIKAA
jgi:hypothetical protein